jgi:hypothetical protein
LWIFAYAYSPKIWINLTINILANPLIRVSIHFIGQVAETKGEIDTVIRTATDSLVRVTAVLVHAVIKDFYDRIPLRNIQGDVYLARPYLIQAGREVLKLKGSSRIKTLLRTGCSGKISATNGHGGEERK